MINILENINEIKANQIYLLKEFVPKVSIVSEIECDKLLEEYLFNKNVIKEMKDLFINLNKKEQSIVYVFEIISEHSYKDIDIVMESFLKNQNEVLKLTLPPVNKINLKKYNNNNPKILYVGKRLGGKDKKDISFIAGRIIHHLGFYTKKNKMNNKLELVRTTSSLQLYHWTQKMNMKLRLHLIEFPTALNSQLGVFEHEIAKKLEPILGQHRQ